MADKISLGGFDEDENTDFTDDSALSTPMPVAETEDMAFFDPLRSDAAMEVCDMLIRYDLFNKDEKIEVCFISMFSCIHSWNV